MVVGFMVFGVLASFPLEVGSTIHAEARWLALGTVVLSAAFAMRAAVRTG